MAVPDRYKKKGFTKPGQRKVAKRKGKKYTRLVKKGDKYKLVSYGAKGMSDFTKHKDEKRRDNFRARHNCSTANDPFTPRYWACKDLWPTGTKNQTGGIVPAYSPYAINQPIPQLNQFTELINPTGRGFVSPLQSKLPAVPGQFEATNPDNPVSAEEETPQDLLKQILDALNGNNGLSNTIGQFGGNNTGNNIQSIFDLLQNGPASTGPVNNVLTSSQGFLGYAELGGKPGQRTKPTKMKKKKLTAAENKLKKILKEQEDRINEFRTDLILDQYENQKKQSIGLFNQKYGDSGLSLQEIMPRSGSNNNPRNFKRGGKVSKKRKRRTMRYQSGGTTRARIQDDGTIEGTGNYTREVDADGCVTARSESGAILDRRCFPNGSSNGRPQIATVEGLNAGRPVDNSVQLNARQLNSLPGGLANAPLQRPGASRPSLQGNTRVQTNNVGTGLDANGFNSFRDQFDPRNPIAAQATLDGLRQSEFNGRNEAKNRSDDRVGKNYSKGFKAETDRRGLTTKEDVTDFQNMLRSEGFDIKADGVYGKKTAEAAESFSRRRPNGEVRLVQGGPGRIQITNNGFAFPNTPNLQTNQGFTADTSNIQAILQALLQGPTTDQRRFTGPTVPFQNGGNIGGLPIPGQVGLNNILPNGQVVGGNLGQSPTTYSPLLLSLEQQQALSRQNQLATLGVPQQTQTLQGGGNLLSAVLSANGVPNSGTTAVAPNPGFRPQAPQVPNTRTPIRSNGLLGGVEPVVVPGTEITFGDPRLDGITTLLTKIPGLNAVVETPLAEARVTIEGVDISESRQKGDRKSNETKRRKKRRRPKGRGCKITPFEGGPENPHRPKVSRRKKYK